MPFNDDHQRLSTVCRLISSGRSIARQLTVAVRRFELNETEFRLLWLLHESSTKQEPHSIDQRFIAAELGLSPAQVSTTVEKLRQQGTIETVVDRKDRRRQLWQLTAEGNERFETISTTIKLLSRDWAFPDSNSISVPSAKEDAA